jgi:N-acyl-D-aspartate/D-glutamate deacylase
MELDLVIRNGTIVDGSGSPRFMSDIGIQNGWIVELGRIRSKARQTVDAEGQIVAPGFIDGHTHMDAQISWDPLGSCSCWHGVTSVVMGNCGFALAPCQPDQREWIARCLEAVEDIPTESMIAGINWTWESFPEYLDAIGKLPKAINYGAFLGHSAIRMYIMGDRALYEIGSEEDLERMGGLVADALNAGAFGFSTSRSSTHLTPDGTPVASRIADWGEIEYLVDVMARHNRGIFQIAPDVENGEAHAAFFARLKEISVNSSRPTMLGVFSTRQGKDPYSWQSQMKALDDIAMAGGRVYGQTTTKSIIAVFSLKSYLPFDDLPVWRELRQLPILQQQKNFRDPDIRRALIVEETEMKPRDDAVQGGGAATTDPRKPNYGNLFALKGVDWDDPSLEELAQQKNQHPVEVMLDLMAQNENQLFVQPINNETPEDVLGMLRHPRTLATFSDSGAHVCQEMASSLQTHLISYWVRGRGVFSLEEAIRMLTSDIASAFELSDRGLLRPGYRADIVIFDEATIRPRLPSVESDLPGGARRLVQKADGIAATFVNGVMAFCDGESTGSYPGEILRANSL